MITRRSFLCLTFAVPLSGCASLLVGAGIGGAAYHQKENIAQLYCNFISCKNGKANRRDLEEAVYWKVVKAAIKGKEAGLEIQKKDVDKLYKEELQMAMQSLRKSGIRVVN